MLINDIIEFKKYYGGIQRTMSWSTFESFVREAELFYIIPFISEEFYEEIIGVETPNAKQTKVLDFLKIAAAAYADFSGYLRLSNTTGDMGKAVASPQHMQAVSKWGTAAGRVDARNRGDRALEMALKYLEKNAADFGTWKSSDAYSLRPDLLVGSAVVLTKFFPHANDSVRMYLGLRKYLEQTQELVPELLGDNFWIVLKAKFIPDTLGGLETSFLNKVRNWMTHKAIADALPYLNISEDWRLISESDGIQNEDMLPRERRQELALVVSDKVKGLYTVVVNFLQENASATVFPEYFNSELYSSRVIDKTGGRFKNDKSKTFGVL
jgi:hypothetical protein